MKSFLQILLFFLLLSNKAYPQLSAERKQVMDMVQKCGFYSKMNFDSAKYFGEKAQRLSKQIKFFEGEIYAMCFLGIAHTRNGDIPKALQLEFNGLQLASENKLKGEQALCLYTISKSYNFLNDFPSAINYGKRARHLFLTLGLQDSINSLTIDEIDEVTMAQQFFDNDLGLGESFLFSNQIDSALHYLGALKKNVKGPFTNIVNIFLGEAYFRSGNREIGMAHLRSALQARMLLKDHYSIAWTCNFLAHAFSDLNQPDSAIFYAKLGLEEAKKVGFKARVLHAAKQLAELYANRDLKAANYYLNLSAKINEELFGSEKFFQLQKTLAVEQQQRQEEEKKQLAYKNTIRQYILIAGISVIIFVAIFLYRNNRQKQKANKVLEATLTNLKSTQSQLVQSEKMASLGELTAGIAHEIQNPLNFVNNFSELNVELVEELKGIRSKEDGDREKGIGNSELEEEIINDIKENSEKINHHGKRAADIVKGMLQHSRSSTGQKEPTDINALCDEYLRLAYHGLRAKDKTFNAEFKTEFDETIGKINVQPQEMGRVVLNLINNAFYACTERSRSAAQLRSAAAESYEPRVTVRTKQIPNPANPQTRNIAIVITDNGTGIPQQIKEKIFQPFFTTKPTGQGTGLGLSLAYDIVTKVHSGKLVVDSEEGKGTTFIVTIPV